MRIGDYSTTQVISIGSQASIDEAIALMEDNGIHHLPVVEGEKLVGMLSDRDILTAVGGLLSKERKLPRGGLIGPKRVVEIMSKRVLTVSPEDSVRLGTRLMLHERIHALPLVREGKLAGLVSASDLLFGIIAAPELTDVTKPVLEELVRPHMRVQVTTVSPKTQISELVDVLRDKSIRHFPVVVADELLGMISDRDLRRTLAEDSIRDAQAQEKGKLYIGINEAMEIMNPAVSTIDPEDTLGKATDEMLSHRIHSLPVVAGKKLEGMITDSDILRVIGEADKMI